MGAKTSSFSYAMGGQTLSQTSPAGIITPYGHDSDYRTVSTSTDPAASQANPDPTSADPSSTTSYDANGQTTQTTTGQGTGQTGVTYAYNADGQVCWQANTIAASHLCASPPASATQYQYDYAGRPVQTTTSQGITTTTSYQYQNNGPKVTSTNGTTQVAATAIYDPDGRLTSLSYTGSDPTTGISATTYDNNGNLLAETIGIGTSADHETYQYSTLGQLLQSSSQTDLTSTPVTNTVNYSYDQVGDLSTITYPGPAPTLPGAKTVNYNPAPWSNSQTITDWLGQPTTYSYNPSANNSTITTPTTTDTFSANPAGQLTGISSVANSNQAPLMSLGYTPALTTGLTSATSSSITSPVGYTSPSTANSYTYYTSAQLSTGSDTTGSNSAVASTYTYDSAGDITSLPAASPLGMPPTTAPTSPSTTATQGFFAGGQLCYSSPSGTSGSCASAPADATTYDAYGNRATQTAPTGSPEAGTTSYSFNARSQLTAVALPASTAPAVTDTYGANGMPITRTTDTGSSAQTSQFVYSGSQLLSDGTNDYVYGPSGFSGAAPLEQIPVSANSASSTLWLHHDNQGSTRLVTDSNGQPVATYSYDEYGALTNETGPANTTPMEFLGEYTDPTTGLSDLGARWYDPTTAQFLSIDPAPLLLGGDEIEAKSN